MSMVPKLRFPEFDDEWETGKLETACTSISSGKSSHKDTGKFPVYGSTGQIGFTDSADDSGPKILIARVGARAGTLACVDGYYGVTDNTLRVTLADNFNLGFVYAILERSDLSSLSYGSGQPLITGTMLKRLPLSAPSLPEQQKIASFLSAVDKKIDLLRQKKEKLEAYKKGLMQAIFSQEIRFKADDGSDFPDWEEVTLGEVCAIKAGDYLEKGAYDRGRYAVEGAGSTMGYHSTRNFSIPTTVIGKVGTVGKPRFFPEGCWVNNNAAGVLPKDGFRAEFLFILLVSLDWKSVTAQTAQPFLLIDDLLSKQFLLPHYEEQRLISAAYWSIQSKIDATELAKEHFETFKKGLLQQMFV